MYPPEFVDGFSRTTYYEDEYVTMSARKPGGGGRRGSGGVYGSPSGSGRAVTPPEASPVAASFSGSDSGGWGLSNYLMSIGSALSPSFFSSRAPAAQPASSMSEGSSGGAAAAAAARSPPAGVPVSVRPPSLLEMEEEDDGIDVVPSTVLDGRGRRASAEGVAQASSPSRGSAAAAAAAGAAAAGSSTTSGASSTATTTMPSPLRYAVLGLVLAIAAVGAYYALLGLVRTVRESRTAHAIGSALRTKMGELQCATPYPDSPNVDDALMSKEDLMEKHCSDPNDDVCAAAWNKVAENVGAFLVVVDEGATMIRANPSFGSWTTSCWVKKGWERVAYDVSQTAYSIWMWAAENPLSSAILLLMVGGAAFVLHRRRKVAAEAKMVQEMVDQAWAVLSEASKQEPAPAVPANMLADAVIERLYSGRYTFNGSIASSLWPRVYAIISSNSLIHRVSVQGPAGIMVDAFLPSPMSKLRTGGVVGQHRGGSGDMNVNGGSGAASGGGGGGGSGAGRQRAFGGGGPLLLEEGA
jgi:hypothetical protein